MEADIWVSSTSGNVSKITIYVRPTADVEVQILATEKVSQEAPGNISGIAPIQEGGKGYLEGVDAKMEYREKGTDTWITCQDNSLGQEVTAGKTYEVRKKGDITKKASPIKEVFVPNKENVTPDPEPNPNPLQSTVRHIQSPDRHVLPKFSASLSFPCIVPPFVLS